MIQPLIRFTVDLDNAWESSTRYNSWVMNEKMWLLASLEALAYDPYNPNPQRILEYYKQIAEQYYGKKIRDIIDEQILVMMSEEEEA